MAEKEFVEKWAALNAICKSCDRRHPDDKENCPQKFAGCMEFYNVFELPAADVRPVVRGKWKHGVCQTCFFDWASVSPIAGVPNFCPNCGADMREE